MKLIFLIILINVVFTCVPWKDIKGNWVALSSGNGELSYQVSTGYASSVSTFDKYAITLNF